MPLPLGCSNNDLRGDPEECDRCHCDVRHCTFGECGAKLCGCGNLPDLCWDLSCCQAHLPQVALERITQLERERAPAAVVDRAKGIWLSESFARQLIKEARHG
jgi:hypothetical protein